MPVLCCVVEDKPVTLLGWVTLWNCPRVGDMLICTLNDGTSASGRISDIWWQVNLSAEMQGVFSANEQIAQTDFVILLLHHSKPPDLDPIPKRPAKAKKGALSEGTAGESNREGRGHLQPHAAKVVMKLLYGLRFAHFDLLHAKNNLAASITKWTPDCDKRFHHIVCYVHSTLGHRLVGFVGDKPMQLATSSLRRR